MKTLLMAGTDTDAGKTIVTTGLRAYYQENFPNLKTGLMKLMQTGEVGDAEFYRQFFDDVVIPLRFCAPLAPPLAADLEQRTIDLDLVYQNLVALQSQCDLLLVEALGGLGSPVTHDLTVADIAHNWDLETIIVAPVKLGSIGHTIANVALAQQKGIKLKGIIFNCVFPCSQDDINRWTPKNLIESFIKVPILGYFPYIKDMNNLASQASIIADSFSTIIF